MSCSRPGGLFLRSSHSLVRSARTYPTAHRPQVRAAQKLLSGLNLRMTSTLENAPAAPRPIPSSSVGEKRKPSRSPSPSPSAAPEAEASTSAAATDKATVSAGSSKAAENDQKKLAKKRRADNKFVSRLRKESAKQISKFGEDPIYYEIQELIGKEKVAAILQSGREFEKKFDIGEELEVEISMLGAHGQGLAVAQGQDWVIAVPKALPGDRVRVQVRSNERECRTFFVKRLPYAENFVRPRPLCEGTHCPIDIPF